LPYYFVMITPGNGVNVQYRDGQGASAQWPANVTDTTPVYLRADRVGTTLSMSATTGLITPANLPFTETIAATSTGMTSSSSGATLAALTNEDGVTLSVGLTGTAPASTPAAGQVHANAVTYMAVEPSTTTPSPTTSDLSLQSTVSGLDARVVIHNAGERGPFTLSLGADPSMLISQDASGAIQVAQPISSYNPMSGTTTASVTRTEYTVQTPILIDSSTAVTAPVSTGPATMTLTADPSGGQDVTVSVDPAWLNDPGRVFPATLDLPIVTAYSSAQTGLWGTVNNCAPNQPAPQTEVVVGVAGGCTYNGQTYFDLTSLPLDTPIMTATLRLYTPTQTTATGVQVYPNAPSAAFNPTTLPSWASAPAISGTTGIVQNGSDGHWQSWDVTNLVQQWVGDNTTNAGLTLVGNGTPLRFALTLGAGTDAATLAPYLDITYDPRPAARGQNYYDGARTIYGISGSFGEDFDRCSTMKACDQGLITYNTVEHQLGGAFVRFGVNLDCASDMPQNGPQPTSWWFSGSGHNPTKANQGDDVDVVTLVRRAYQAGLIPIVNFLLPGGDVGCRNLYSPDYGYHTNKSVSPGVLPHPPLWICSIWTALGLCAPRG